jgi:flagellar assembly protein FliH
MKWSETIIFAKPIREVRLLTEAPRQDWQVFAREREETAYDRGRCDGEKGLREQLLQQRSEIAELQAGVLNSLRTAVTQVVQETESALLRLALECAQKVVAKLPVNVELVEGVVREALHQVEDTAEITIQLHAEDLALLRKNNAAVLKPGPDSGPLRFVASTEVSPGGCVIQTRFGLIDARRETKVEQLRQTLCG